MTTTNAKSSEKRKLSSSDKWRNAGAEKKFREFLAARINTLREYVRFFL